MTSIVEVALRVRLEEAERERDEALKQARYAWERHAEKDRAYGDALRERDEARAANIQLDSHSDEAAYLRRCLDEAGEHVLAVEHRLEEACAALGAAWMTGGVSLAEGIRRKTAALENLR